MTIENIEKRILESAGSEAETILRTAREQAARRTGAAKARSDARSRHALDEARAALQRHHDQQLTSARAANKLKLLAAESAILDDVFAQAAERFIGSRSGPYQAWLAAQLESVAGEQGVIVPANDDRTSVETLLAGLRSQGRGDGLRVSDESLPLRGGFVINGEKIDLDLSLDTQLAALKQELLPELAARAFGPAPRVENVS